MNSTGKGVLTEIYVDTDAEETTVVVINTYLAEVSADYNTKTEDVRLDVYTGVKKAAAAGQTPTTISTTYTVESEDVDGLEKLKEDDMVLVTIAKGDVMTVTPVETVKDVAITSYSTDYADADKKDEYKLTKLTAGGNKYETAKKAFEDAEVLYDYNVEQLDDATFDKNNVITEMEAQAYTAAKNWNTKQYKDDGYAFLNVANKSELTAKGATLWIDDAASNDKYILLDEDCKIFVRASDDDEDDYTEYSNIKSALSALGEDSNFTGTIAAFVDDAGIATTLILNDTYKANDKPNTNPSKPTSTDVDSVKLTIKGSKGLIELFNKKGDALTDGTVKHTFELYQYVAGQNNYVKVDEGDYFYGVTPAFSVAGGNSYYVVIDGVQSNIARA